MLDRGSLQIGSDVGVARGVDLCRDELIAAILLLLDDEPLFLLDDDDFCDNIDLLG
ncbi:MAG: hypothetical protein JXR80_09735 [Deltaproteobacteria bacterium]|nr:hypothetical protein [Deltaproteobacteria bacterium]